MSKDLRNIIIGLIILFLLLTGAFLGGWSAHKKFRPCPIITSDTILIHDTVTHIIPDTIPYYSHTTDTIIQHDSVTMPLNIDTLAVIKDYYASHFYTRNWRDTIIDVTLKDVISRNRPIDNTFTYKLLKPQTTIINNIDNSITYNRYLQIGISDQIGHYENVGLNAQFIMPKWYVDYEWIPNIKSHSVGVGVTLFKMRKTR